MMKIDLSNLNKVGKALVMYGLGPWGIGCGVVGAVVGVEILKRVMLHEGLTK